jgi:GNAT superfamily N-acetyltransferase
MGKSPFTCRELTEADWPLIRELFGPRGACGGCWCMWWRVPRGGKTWDATKGEPNRRKFKKLVEAGDVRGILALEGNRPVGWCSFGRRLDFPRTETVKAYRRDDIAGAWCINCFYVAKSHRHRGLARLLAEAAVRAIKRRRGRVIEAYPVMVTAGSRPDIWLCKGPHTLFEELGFTVAQRLSEASPLYRLELR